MDLLCKLTGASRVAIPVSDPARSKPVAGRSSPISAQSLTSAHQNSSWPAQSVCNKRAVRDILVTIANAPSASAPYRLHASEYRR